MSERESFFGEFRELVQTWLQTRLELAKLEAFEKAGKLIAFLITGLILSLLAFFGLAFFSFSLGYYFGERLQSLSLGFGLVSLLYLLLFGVLWAFRRQLFTGPLTWAVIKLLSQGSEKEDV